MATITVPTLSVCKTDDGGVVIELEFEDTGRNLLLAVPHAGETVYFTALEEKCGFRASGIARDGDAVGSLIEWLFEKNGEFPSAGLDLG